MVQAKQRLPRATGKEKRSFPMKRGSVGNQHPAWKPQCAQTSRKLFCPNPKAMPRFTVRDVREERWLLSHRWTETNPIFPEVAHDGHNQRRVVSLSPFRLLSTYVRYARSRAQSAPYRWFTCTSLILRLRVMLKVPSQSSVRM